jgi:UDP-N-acetylglucosamine acyltransferase
MKTTAVDCHPTAVVHPGARLAEGVRVGPYAVIGEHVVLGRDTVVEAQAMVDGHTTIGERCRIFPFASIGLEPQDLKFRGEPSTLEIGDENVFREFVTIHRGTAAGAGRTVIGQGNLFMAYVHIAHDCVVGSRVIFANGASLAGHVLVEDHATIGAFSGIHQFCRVGTYAFIGAYTVVPKDVLPFSLTVGNRARLHGVNTVGLLRRGFDRERVRALRQAFRVLHQRKLNVSQALAQLEADSPNADVRLLIDFVRSSKRGVVSKRGREPRDPAETE